MRALALILSLLAFEAGAADKCVRADGTAANYAAAASCAAAATAMSVTTLNGATCEANDRILFSSRGGTFTDPAITLPCSTVEYLGEPGYEPTFIRATSTPAYLMDTNGKDDLSVSGFTASGNAPLIRIQNAVGGNPIIFHDFTLVGGTGTTAQPQLLVDNEVDNHVSIYNFEIRAGQNFGILAYGPAWLHVHSGVLSENGRFPDPSSNSDQIHIRHSSDGTPRNTGYALVEDVLAMNGQGGGSADFDISRCDLCIARRLYSHNPEGKCFSTLSGTSTGFNADSRLDLYSSICNLLEPPSFISNTTREGLRIYSGGTGKTYANVSNVTVYSAQDGVTGMFLGSSNEFQDMEIVLKNSVICVPNGRISRVIDNKAIPVNLSSRNNHYCGQFTRTTGGSSNTNGTPIVNITWDQWRGLGWDATAASVTWVGSTDTNDYTSADDNTYDPQTNVEWNTATYGRLNADDGSRTISGAIGNGVAITKRLDIVDWNGTDVPDGATITGVKWTLDRSSSTGTRRFFDLQTRLIVGGAPTGNNLGNKEWNEATSNLDVTTTYGSQTELWGLESLTPAQVNASNFGIAVQYHRPTAATTTTVGMDFGQFDIYYFTDGDVSTYGSAPQFLGGSSPTTAEGFRPDYGSPLVGAGTPVGVKYDFSGYRFNVPPSIGAFEVPGPSTFKPFQ
jgi:hypothetical protein